MYNTWGLDIVWVREMGLEVYALVIFSSLALLAVAVDAQNDFGEETNKKPPSSTMRTIITGNFSIQLFCKVFVTASAASLMSLLAGLVEHTILGCLGVLR